MYIFNFEIWVIALIICMVEIGTLSSISILYLSRPHEKRRLRYCLLLAFFTLCNITYWFIPDKNLQLTLAAQNMIHYGSGFLTLADIPGFLYLVSGIIMRKRDANFGTLIQFLILSGISLAVGLRLIQNPDFSSAYAELITAVDSVLLVLALFEGIRPHQKNKADITFGYKKAGLYQIYIVLTIVILRCLLVCLQISHWIQIILMNAGFVIVTIMFLCKTIRFERESYMKLYAIYNSTDVRPLLGQNCVAYGLTNRETEIALLISRGIQYKFIAGQLFISLDTVKSHVKNIFRKVGVNDKTELVYKLGLGVI